MWRIIGDRHLGLIAAGVAFYAVFSIFPGLAALIALWGMWFDPALIARQIDLLREFLPPEAFGLLQGQVDLLVAASPRTLRWATVLSLGVAIWSARAGVAALMQGLHAIHHDVEERGGLAHIAMAMLLTVALIGAGLVALLAVVVLPILLALLPEGPWTGLLPAALQWGSAIAAAALGVALLYRYGPHRPGGRSPWLSPGLLLALLVWGAASYAFSHYLAGLAQYDRIYGPIGAVFALLTWVYLSVYVVLLGAALNEELERMREEEEAAAEEEKAGAGGGGPAGPARAGGAARPARRRG